LSFENKRGVEFEGGGFINLNFGIIVFEKILPYKLAQEYLYGIPWL